MRFPLLLGVAGLSLAGACTSQDAIPEVNEPSVSTSVATTATTTAPLPPAGLATHVTISVRIDGVEHGREVTVVNDQSVGVFGPLASCSLAEGGGWFPLEVVVSESSSSPFLRLSSIAQTPSGLGAIDGQLAVRDPDGIAIDAAVTVYVGDGGTSGSFAGTSDDGRDVSGEFDCKGSSSNEVATDVSDIELSVRLSVADEFGNERVRRLGFRAVSAGQCPSGEEVTSQRWQIVAADHPVGGFTGAVLRYNSANGRWSGELSVANSVITIDSMSVAAMPTGIVFSGVSAEGISADGALSC